MRNDREELAVVDEVDDKAFDMRAILILIGHHHQFPIAKGL